MSCERWRPGDPPERLRAALARGAILAIPTESSYGLAVDPLDPAGVERIFELKGRSGSKALPVVGRGADDFARLGVDPAAPGLAWAAAYWPAALTVVVPLARPIPASAGEATLAVRVPGSEALLALLAQVDRPLTATSANPSGAPPFVDPEPLAAWLGQRPFDALLVDAGALPGGPPSTLVTFEAGRAVVVRPGRFAIA